MDHDTSTPPAGTCDEEEIDRAIAAAVANAAFEGIVIEPDEQALGRRRLRGEISHPEFLRLLRELAVSKAKTMHD